MPLNKISEKVSGMGGLQTRIGMVTGVGAGMGREHALLLAERGATVVVQDIDGEGARETAERSVGEWPRPYCRLRRRRRDRTGKWPTGYGEQRWHD
jgi:NAD(P)-dependent dehydrogenase (short-subunit alcohol dehydrogenase family)